MKYMMSRNFGTKEFDLDEILGNREPVEITDEVSACEFPHSRMEYRSEGLSPEAPELFNYESLSFEEMASSISEDVIELHNIAEVTNRFAQTYLELSRLLERGIAEVASCWVTRAAFEKQGVVFKSLNMPGIPQLYGIVSGHFRKCHAAVRGTTIQNRKFWTAMLEMEIRWYHLARRLKATEDRIGLIRAGKISIDKMLEKLDADLLRDRSAAPKKQTASEGTKALPEGKVVSFPVLGTFLREKFGKGAEREKEPVPVSASEKSETSKVYASMKQRKKAERLARKHAAEKRAEQEKNERNSFDLQVPERISHDPDEVREHLSSMGIWPEDPDIQSALLSRGVPLPVIA